MTSKLGTLGKIATWIAIAMSAYHLYTGAFGAPEALLHRSIHLMFTMGLIFLLYPFSKEKGPISAVWEILFFWEFPSQAFSTFSPIMNISSPAIPMYTRSAPQIWS
jgi:TRAP-type uncharacterized transport system fused permease subunit